MRICLVVHGFPPYELAGVETYTAGLARALGQRGHTVELLAFRSDPGFGNLSLRREERDGFALTWLNSAQGPKDPAEALDPPGIAEVFGQFLDSEKPDLVHFQHVVKLGLGLVEAARERGLPTCWTAHDYFGVCHRFTLLRPDLQRCETIGDPAACARCDLASAVLNEQPGLGDYQLGVLEDQLDEAGRARLEATLAGEPEGSGFEPGAVNSAVELRTKLDERRRDVLAQIDRVFVPTHYLLERLVEGGLDRARTQHLPYGVEVRGLGDLTRPDPAAVEAGRPLRLGFVGSLTKHKGVHVLLEAFARVQSNPALRGRLELTVSGDSSDRVYVERLRTRAAELGVTMAGRFQPEELPGRLAAADLMVVPSTWVENQPLAIREAFAAGRPVVTSRLGALPESVEDGVDGLLFEPGDAEDLAGVFARLIQEPGLFARLCEGVPKIKGSGEQAAELEPAYEELLRGRREARVAKASEWTKDLPHLKPLAERYAELGEKSTRDLFGQVLAGIERLADGLGADAEGAGRWMHLALRSHVRVQAQARENQAELDYLQGEVEGQRESVEALKERVDWRERELAERDEEASWLRQSAEEAERERAWLREQIERLEAERDWLKGNLEQLESERDALGEKATWLEGEVGHREEELVWRRGEMEKLERVTREAEELRSHAARLEDALGEWHVAVQRGLEPLTARLESDGEESPEGGVDPRRMELGLGRLAKRLERLEHEAETVATEARWRREQMDALQRSFNKSKGAWLLRRTAVGRAVAAWQAGSSPGSSEGAQ